MIWAERQRLPAGFLEHVIEYRTYAAAVAANNIDPKGYMSTPMRRLAMTIDHDLALEAMGRG